MATDLLKNVLLKIDQAVEISRLPDWYHTELRGFKSRWSTDMLVEVSDPEKPGYKKTQSFKVVRVRHRTPDNSWITGGGHRYHPDVGLSQMESHAVEMSIKSWIMGIPHGGSKGGIALDPSKLSWEDLAAITVKCVQEAIEAGTIGPMLDRWAPDVGTNAQIMKWMQDEFAYEMRKHHVAVTAATVTGKPIEYGGMPGRVEATGRGLHYALQLFRKRGVVNLPSEPRVILQGFGNVGFNFAKLANEFGIRIVAVQDQYGGVHHPNLPLEELLRYVESHPQKSVAGFHEICGGDFIRSNEELFSIEADVALPAALEEVITPKIAERLKVKVLLEGANGPTLPEADNILENRRILVIPDIYANAGGVTVSYFEWAKDTGIKPFDDQLKLPKERDEGLVFASLQQALKRNGDRIIGIQQNTQYKGRPISFRLASYIYALDRVLPHFAAKRRKRI